MTFGNVGIYVALIAFVVIRRVMGRPVESTKKLFLLPVILTVIGYTEMSHATLDSIDVAVTVTGGAISLGLGALRGRFDKLSVRNGLPWVQWGGASVAIFAINLASKLVLDVGGVAIGGTAAGITNSLLLAFGLMMLGEATVVWLRLQPGTTATPDRSSAN